MGHEAWNNLKGDNARNLTAGQPSPFNQMTHEDERELEQVIVRALRKVLKEFLPALAGSGHDWRERTEAIGKQIEQGKQAYWNQPKGKV